MKIIILILKSTVDTFSPHNLKNYYYKESIYKMKNNIIDKVYLYF